MIQIDDSGWGCLLGGVMIGIYADRVKKFRCGLIPVKYFRKGLFETGQYRTIAWDIVEKNVDLNRSKDDTFVVCKGTCLDVIFSNLSDFKVVRQEIQDPLQSWLEQKFAKTLIKVGVPQKTEGAHCLTFDDQVKWALEDKKNRSKYIKTGWKSWQQKYSKM